jgi:predicted transcriptional regulator
MDDDDTLISLTADIVCSHLENNRVAVGDVPNLIQQVHSALAGLGAPAVDKPQEKKTPVVTARASIKPDYLVCMECGKKQKTLRRHLQTAHGLTPDQYRADYGLPRDYPMTAATYSETRRTMAHSIGLGRKGRENRAEKTSPSDRRPASKGNGRRKEAPAEDTPPSGE